VKYLALVLLLVLCSCRKTVWKASNYDKIAEITQEVQASGGQLHIVTGTATKDATALQRYATVDFGNGPESARKKDFAVFKGDRIEAAHDSWGTEKIIIRVSR
jgi:hypothetical protein